MDLSKKDIQNIKKSDFGKQLRAEKLVSKVEAKNLKNINKVKSQIQEDINLGKINLANQILESEKKQKPMSKFMKRLPIIGGITAATALYGAGKQVYDTIKGVNKKSVGGMAIKGFKKNTPIY
tara:strand:- start:153 stop:521 length:369 start_codon:yes stop_codon:yes gene_type:complete